MDRNTRKLTIIFVVLIFLFIIIVSKAFNNNYKDEINEKSNEFKLISSTENSDLEGILKSFATKNDIDLTIEYAGTIDIMDKLNSGEKYDAVWASNSIWLYMLDSKVAVKNSKSTSINPVVFAIKKSKAQELEFINKDVYTKDILNAIQAGKLKFNMASATRNKYRCYCIFRFFKYTCGKP